MKTTRGCTVKWGRAPGREGAAEFNETLAARVAEQTVELQAIIPAAESTSRMDQNLAAATMVLKDKELSKLEQAPWGAFAIQLHSRGPVEPFNGFVVSTHVGQCVGRGRRAVDRFGFQEALAVAASAVGSALVAAP